MKEINEELYERLHYLGLVNADETRNNNVGESNYSDHVIQPWTIWLDYPELSPWDADIIKRVLRHKTGENDLIKYEKIIHICKERIRQINARVEILENYCKNNIEEVDLTGDDYSKS